MKTMNENKSTINSHSTSSPIRKHFADVSNRNYPFQPTIDEDRRWKLLSGNKPTVFQNRSSFITGAPSITIDNDENDPWNEYRDFFESNQSHMLNPSTGNPHYLLRHSSANTSLNESSSLDALAGNACTSLDGNHEDIFSFIEQAGITFSKKRISCFSQMFMLVFRCINWFIIR